MKDLKAKKSVYVAPKMECEKIEIMNNIFMASGDIFTDDSEQIDMIFEDM
ncbi:MAG: hypothetical protein ACOYEA_08215 [Fermentimonas sp.]|jgi:hypothetical protein